MGGKIAERVSKTISVAALKQECGPHIGESVLRQLKRLSKPKVPDLDQLQVGDIILSRPKTRLGKPAPSLVCEYQKTVAKFHADDAFWSHAMLYVGNLHVVESQKIYRVKEFLGFKSGTRVCGLLDYSQAHELIICRYAGLNGYDDVQANIARYALLDQAVNRRKYSYARIIEMMNANAKKYAKPEFGRAVICSEYALECLAIGGSCMTEEFNDLGEERRFFFPADFHKSSKFEKIELPTLDLVDG